MKKVKWKIKPITLATTVVLASGIGAVSCVRMNHKQIENIQKSIEDNHFLLDCYGSVDGNLELSKIEEKVYDEQDTIFMTMENDFINVDNINNAISENKNIGLIVKPTDYTYASIYRTIDKVKEYIENYEITSPILYDISKLMEDDTIRANCLLAEEFCNKLTANGCYVGLYGTEQDMTLFSEKFKEVTNTKSIDLYDKLIVVDSLTSKKYRGNYNMIQLDNGIVLCKYDLSSVIHQNDLNNPENFIDEFVYTVKSGDILANIATDYNIKISDLAEYNNIDPNVIFAGDEIIIPNNYLSYDLDSVFIDKTALSTEMQAESLNRLAKGIDVSKYQINVDWETVKKNIDFAILQICDFYYKTPDNNCILDDQFLRNIEACEKLNIPVGVYYFSRATNKEEAIQEAQFVSEKLKSYSLEYPVYMDVETETLNNMMVNNPEQFKEIATAAMSVLEEKGYFAGIYCNKTYFNNISDLSNKYSFWLTSSETYNQVIDFETFKQQNANILYIPNNNVSMYQYSCFGMIDGIYGNVDINYATKVLEKTIHDGKFNRKKEE